MARSLSLPIEELRARYAAGESTSALARRFRCSPTTIAARLRAGGQELRSSRFQPAQVPAEALRRLYANERLSIAELARHFGVSPSTIGNKRREYGISPRPRREKNEGAG